MWEFVGTVQKGKMVFSDTQILVRQQALYSLKDGEQIFEQIGRYRQPKSQQQLGAYFGLFCAHVIDAFEDRGWDSSFIFHLDKPTGVEVSVDLLKEYMYSVCPVHDSDGKRITISKMDTSQMAKFFDDCRNWAASQWSIIVPEPQKDWRDLKR
jgi:hypothetical protein